MKPLLAALALVTAATPMKAQERGDTARPIPLPGIEVTVLRTPVLLIDAPWAVNVARPGAARLTRPGLAVDEPLRALPGVQVENRFNYALGERISVRGFGARAQFGIRGVKVLVDGIPATLPDGQTALSHLDPTLVSRAEILRGPASTQWGGNALGGVLQLETAGASAATLAPALRVLAGGAGLMRYEAELAGTRGPNAFRVSASYVDDEGFREHAAARVLRVSSRWQRGGDARFLRVVGAFNDYDALAPGGLYRQQLAADREAAHPGNVAQGTGEEARQAQLGAVARAPFAGGSVEAMLYVLTRDVANPIPPAIIDLERFAGGGRVLWQRPLGGRAALTLGVESDVQRDDRRNWENDAGERGALTLDQLENVLSAGAFAQASLAPIGRVRLLGGVRADHYRFEADDRLVSAGDPDDSGERSMGAVSPSLGALVRITDGLRLYGNVASAFATPTTTELANRPDGAGGFNPDLEPQRARSYEAGAKGVIGDVVFWELAAFRTDVEDELVPFQVATAPGRDFFRNAGESRHQGVEAGITFAPRSGVSLRAAYTHLDARYVDCGDTIPDCDGNRIPGIARHRFDASLSVDRDAWHLTLDGRWRSAMPVNDGNSEASPSALVADASAGARLRVRGASVEPFLGVTNLFDAEYDASVVINAFGGRYYEPGPGRRVYGGVRVAM